MNNLDITYKNLLQDILDNGVIKKDRTGTGTISVFGRQIRHKMSEGFPLLTTKKMHFKSIVIELLWFLQGDTNIKYLLENGCNIWTGDAFKHYVSKTSANSSEWDGWMRDNDDGTVSMYTKEQFVHKIVSDEKFAKKWGDLGPIYGKQWRHWETEVLGDGMDFVMDATNDNMNFYGIETVKRLYEESLRERNHIDQIRNLIDELKTNPDSRRLMVNAWNVSDISKMILPPCHYGFQVFTRELTEKERKTIFLEHDNYRNKNANFKWNTLENIPKRAISLMWNQRSVDTFLGLPFNIASYGLLLTMLADEMMMVPDELIGNLGDTHLYLNHVEAAKEQLTREPFELPNVVVQDGLFCSSINDVFLENYQFHPPIKADLSN